MDSGKFEELKGQDMEHESEREKHRVKERTYNLNRMGLNKQNTCIHLKCLMPLTATSPTLVKANKMNKNCYSLQSVLIFLRTQNELWHARLAVTHLHNCEQTTHSVLT